MKRYSVAMAVMALAGCGTPSSVEQKFWADRVAQVHIGMRRDDVERILPPLLIGTRSGTSMGGYQSDHYFVARHFSVLILYDHSGSPRDSEKVVSLNLPSPENRVIKVPELIYHFSEVKPLSVTNVE